MRLQRTLKNEVFARGIGLHSGKVCSVLLRPASRDTGVVFRKRGVDIPASAENVCETAFATSLCRMGVKIRTVEHLLASLSALNVDNVVIEVEGPEIPILDGSAEGYVDLIMKAGVAQQRKEKAGIRVLRPVIYAEGRSYVMALPYPGFRISHRISFEHPLLKDQQYDIDITERSFVEQIAMARTFGFLRDVEALRRRGLALGGSLNNAIVISDDRILNGGGLRFGNEFVRHKILDCVGDFSLLGRPLHARVIACRSGHAMNLKFVNHLLRARDCWELETRRVGADEAPVYWQPTEAAAVGAR